MVKINLMSRGTVMLVAVAYLTGCAAPGGKGIASNDECNTAATAATGAILALIANAALGDSRNNAKAAALGAAAGAGLCIYANSQRMKTAEQSDADYRQQNGTLPPEPRVVNYSSKTSSPTVQRGTSLKISSNFELVNGSRTKVSDVKEQLVVLDSNGKEVKSGSKPINLQTAGAYNNTFTLTMPSDVPQGKYTMQTKLFVNGNELARSAQATQVVWDGSNAIVLASR